jgi:hypothetical protein
MQTELFTVMMIRKWERKSLLQSLLFSFSMAKSFSFSFGDADFGNQFSSSYQAFSLFMESDQLRDSARAHAIPNNVPAVGKFVAFMIIDLDLP